MSDPARADAPPRGFAFFDFDHTLLHGDAGPLFGRHLFRDQVERLRRRRLGPRRALRSMRFWTGLVSFGAWMGLQSGLYKAGAVRRSTIVRNAYRGLRGVPVAPFEDRIPAFVDAELRPRLYPEVLAEMERHAAAGRPCVIVTTGMEAVVEPCLAWFPPGTRLIGCELEARDGRLTGRVIQGPLYGQDKANIILAYCRASGVDPRDCFAYSDHYSDHQMLAAVGDAVCVNPRKRLRRLAARRGWHVLECPDPRDQQEGEG